MDIKELLDAYKQLDSMEDPTGMNEERVNETTIEDGMLSDETRDDIIIKSDILGFGVGVDGKKDENTARISVVTYGTQAHFIDLPAIELQEIIERHMRALENEIIDKCNK